MQLLQRVNDLEAELKRLKGAESTPAEPAALVATVTPTPSPPVQAAKAPTAASTGMENMPGMGVLPEIAGLQFRGFADFGFIDSNQKGAHSTFSLGSGTDLSMTSKLSDQFSFVGELLFEYAGASNSISTDFERVELHYTPSDYFNLTFGRFHTAIGYYNTAYHHANWLIPTASRPFLFSFEDQGGPLPTHTVGVSATGAVPSGFLGLHYIAEIGNGRTSHSISQSTAEQVQNVQDEDSRKSYDFAAFSRPAAIPGFQTGFSVYGDRLYPTALPKIAQTIWDGYVTYHPSGFEFTTEVLEFRHALEGTNIVYHMPGFYTLLSKDVGHAVKPYFSWEYFNAAKNEPLFGTTIGLRHGPSTGVRWDFTDFAAFKLEYYRLMRRGQLSVDGVRADIAFTF